jgi:hypothetical protein
MQVAVAVAVQEIQAVVTAEMAATEVAELAVLEVAQRLEQLLTTEQQILDLVAAVAVAARKDPVQHRVQAVPAEAELLF